MKRLIFILFLLPWVAFAQQIKISQLPAANALSSTDVFPITQYIGLTSVTLVAGSNGLTCASTTGVYAPSAISGAGIPSGTTVQSVANSTALVLSQPASANESGSTATVSETNAATPVQVGTFVDTGVTNGSSAAAGQIGELLSAKLAVGSPVSLSNNTPATAISISLTAGDWDVSANVNFTTSSATVTQWSAGIISSGSALPTDGTEVNSGLQLTTTTVLHSIALPRQRVSITTTTVIKAQTSVSFSAGTVGAYGSITARRVR